MPPMLLGEVPYFTQLSTLARTPALATKPLSPRASRAPRTASVKSGGSVVPPSYIVRWISKIPFSVSGISGMPTPADQCISFEIWYSSPSAPQSAVQRYPNWPVKIPYVPEKPHSQSVRYEESACSSFRLCVGM